ncbi:hypothetical protein [Paludisphaera rhizosphaerae]|uniref:hypothetical protein n=1 Tax=Paludisphaera rhizosphaerae TaxID=2711216 RepID=UPI00197EFC41|nr:hypothetical protein [Paludisphaera rhizosphaerae]
MKTNDDKKGRSGIHSALVGSWRSTHEVSSNGSFVPIIPRFAFFMTLRMDGAADYRNASNEWSQVAPPSLPFSAAWSINESMTLTIKLPVSPMPEYGILEWTHESLCYDVVDISENAITLSNRAHDGESIILMSRENPRDHH